MVKKVKKEFFSRSVKWTVVGGIIGLFLGVILGFVLHFSEGFITNLVNLFLLGILSGGLLSLADHRSKVVRKPLNETYALFGAFLGIALFFIPAVVETFGLFSVGLLGLFSLLLGTIGFETPENLQILFWIIHLALGAAVGYTVGYFVNK